MAPTASIGDFDFLTVEEDYRKFNRTAHLKYFYLPGRGKGRYRDR